jgi:hypothetical protein
MARERFRDRTKAPGPATLIKFQPGEAWRDRHARRLAGNLAGETEMRQWAEQQGLTLRVKNQGHHWTFECSGFVAEWWPSSAKLVIGKRYRDGVHVHDYLQAQKVIKRAMPEQKKEGQVQP